MKLERVKYAMTKNLGNFENERIEVEAAVEGGETYEDVLSSLKRLVVSGAAVSSPSAVPGATKQIIPLYNYRGEVLTASSDPASWVKAFDNGLGKTRDIRGYYSKNQNSILQVKALLGNGAALSFLEAAEQRALGMMQ